MGKSLRQGNTCAINVKHKEFCVLSSKSLNADFNSWGKMELSSQKTHQGYSVGGIGCSCVFYTTVPRSTISDSVSADTGVTALSCLKENGCPAACHIWSADTWKIIAGSSSLSGGYLCVYIYIYVFKELEHFILFQRQSLEREHICPGSEIWLLPGVSRQPFRFRKIRM